MVILADWALVLGRRNDASRLGGLLGRDRRGQWDNGRLAILTIDRMYRDNQRLTIKFLRGEAD